MLLPVILCAVAAAASPVTYDERQHGDLNVRADVQNVVLLVALPSKRIPSSIFDGFFKSVKREDAQERADVQVMEAFVEPSTPYRVEIGESSGRFAEGDGRAVEVVIAGRRRVGADVQAETEDKVQTEEKPQEKAEAPAADHIKLLGAMEQCGPDRERDPVTLTCRWRSKPLQPEVVPASNS